MSAETNKRLMIRWLEEVFNQGNLASVDELAASDAVFHGPYPTPDVVGTDGVKQFVRDFRAGLADPRFTLEVLIAEGDLTAHRVTTTGIHRGELLGIPPTGNPVTMTSMTIFRWNEGRLVEGWDEWDLGGLRQRLRAGG
jgi:predicted ester cyclase